MTSTARWVGAGLVVLLCGATTPDVAAGMGGRVYEITWVTASTHDLLPVIPVEQAYGPVAIGDRFMAGGYWDGWETDLVLLYNMPGTISVPGNAPYLEIPLGANRSLGVALRAVSHSWLHRYPYGYRTGWLVDLVHAWTGGDRTHFLCLSVYRPAPAMGSGAYLLGILTGSEIRP